MVSYMLGDSMDSRRVRIISFVLIMFLFLSLFIYKFSNSSNSVNIDNILNSNAYSYLPKSSKKYIKEVYEKTGNIIYTEKNKELNKPYLNPLYVTYLEYSEEEKEKLGEIPVSLVVDYVPTTEMVGDSLPSSYDLRNVGGKNFVSPIRDQGNLGICWTFASASSAESYLLKKNNTSYNSSSRLISERQIDYATAVNSIKDYENEYVTFVSRTLGDGGNFFISTIAMAGGISLVDYNNFKEYDDTDFEKMELSEVLSYEKSLYELNATVNMPEMELRASTSQLSSTEQETRNTYINTIKQSIMDNGVAYVSTYMDSSCQYKDTNLNNTVIDVYNCNYSGGHAMGIIGWNDNLQYKYCNDNNKHSSNITNCSNVVSGKGVWILKNSWGNIMQYPYLTYDSLESSVHFITDLRDNTTDNWENNYVLGDGEYGYQNKTYSLTNTKIKNDEIIKKIKFISLTENTSFTVKVKKKDGSFETVTKSVTLPGLLTIDMPNNVDITKNSTINITSNGYFIDRILVFTDNVDNTPYIDVAKFNDMAINDSEKRFYSDTKNIPSGSVITYKVYNTNNVIVGNKVTVTNNVVAENNVNTLISFSDDMEHGIYRIDAIYANNVIGSFNVNIVRMEGLGTEEQPFIIKNASQLSQIRNNPSAYYELANDIDLTEETRKGGSLSQPSDVCPEVFGWQVINDFSGSLDGKGHTIKGLYQNNYVYCVKEDGNQWWNINDEGNGLFGTVKGNAQIKNLVLDSFDITCQGGYCGALVSNYTANLGDNNDTTTYTANFNNIAIKNSHITGLGDADLFGGGLFGHIESKYGAININGIYLDIDRDLTKFESDGYLINTIEANEANISNIHATGDYVGTANNSSVLINEIYANKPISIKNVLSTMTVKNTSSNLFGEVHGDNLTISGVNLFENENKPLCPNNKCSNATNVNVYDKDTELDELTKSTNYNTWDNFSNNWVIKTINGVNRIPILKFMSFEYSEVNNINLNQQLNNKVSIYNYLIPQVKAAKRISYKSNDESIVTITDEGILIPQKSGQTTIHIENLYDGYIKDVPITVNYVPHYTISFNANGGIGEMDDIEVAAGRNYNLPNNTFTKEEYEFKEWNTEADGTGISYANYAQIPGKNDKEILTLYVKWQGLEQTVTFDANGGTVSPTSKKVRKEEVYGELPIPKRSGYGFRGWYCDDTLVSAKDVLSCTNLKARWQEEAYTVIYDGNGGTIKEDNIDNIYVISDSIFTIVGTNSTQTIDNYFLRDGYEFKKWNTKQNGTGTSYQTKVAILEEDIINSEVRLYAIWEGEEGLITFHANDGTNNTKTQLFNYGVNTKLNKNTFTRNGYEFKGWNTLSNGTGTNYSDEQTINISQNIDLYAKWESLFDYEINDYTVGNGIIGKITINTEVNTFKSHIRLGAGYTVEVDYKTINGKNLLYTGGKTRIKKNGILYREFTNSITGEITGDGIINSADLLKTVKHLKGTSVLNGAFIKAADCNGDNIINSADLLKIVKFLKGTGSL